MSTDWLNWLIRTNFTDHAAALEVIPRGPLNDEGDLRAVTAAFDAVGPMEARGKWSFGQMADTYSLYGVEVLYNGLNDRSFPTLSLFKYCLKIKFPTWSVTPPAQTVLYLCYNDPVIATE